MKHPIAAILLAFAGAGACAGAAAQATVGQPAPDFQARDTAGRTVRLSDFRGLPVVLEWVNPGCPYVQKHYGAGNMQATQRSATAKGGVWLTINSTAADHVDYLPPERLSGWMRDHRAGATATLMDADGRIGRAYGAKATPHLFVIDTAGKLVYAGAIDSKPSARVDDIATATNYVTAALTETLAGRPVTVASTRAYGCSVKYQSPL